MTERSGTFVGFVCASKRVERNVCRLHKADTHIHRRGIVPRLVIPTCDGLCDPEGTVVSHTEAETKRGLKHRSYLETHQNSFDAQVHTQERGKGFFGWQSLEFS